MEPNVTQPKRVFEGQGIVFCFNRLITSKDKSLFALSLSLIIVGEVLFVVFEYPFLTYTYRYLLIIPDCILFLYCIVMMLKTAFTDPGFNRRDSIKDIDKHFEAMIFYYGDQKLTEVEGCYYIRRRINGIEVTSKFCSTCNFFRPPRCSHCSVCDACVNDFDHHCPWLGNCVGQRNYVYYFLFLMLLLFLIFYHIIFMSIHLAYVHSKVTHLTGVTVSNIPSMFNLFYHVVAFLAFFGLFNYHLSLISYNMTTNEDIKKVFASSGMNPFSVDGIMRPSCENMFRFFAKPRPISVLDLQGRSKMKMYCKKTSAYAIFSSKALKHLYKQIRSRETDYLLQNNFDETKRTLLQYSRV